MSSTLYVAIDTPQLDKAKALISQIHNHIGGIKLGLEFFCANGHHGVREIKKSGLPIFLDLKLHDIPNTVAKAVQAINALEPAIITIHASGGRAMMEDAKAAAGANTKVVAVTVLTSLDNTDLEEVGLRDGANGQALRLAHLARRSGLDGIVCSGAEVGAIREAWPEGFLVVPGVRPAGGVLGDQKRAVTPREALDSGASILVIGRPITQAHDPDSAAREIEATL
jgi:orotidine-5'-phosphate decarboxylase